MENGHAALYFLGLPLLASFGRFARKTPSPYTPRTPRGFSELQLTQTSLKIESPNKVDLTGFFG